MLHNFDLTVCVQCFVPHGSPINTLTLRTLTSGCSTRTFASQPVLCCQQWQEGVDLIHFYSTSCYSTLNTELGERLCLRRAWRRGRMIGSPPSLHTKHKCGDGAREKESERAGRSLVGLFYHRAIIQSLVNIEEKLSTNTRTAPHGHNNQSWKKKRDLAALIKADSCCTVLQQLLLLNFC